MPGRAKPSQTLVGWTQGEFAFVSVVVLVGACINATIFANVS